MPLFWLALAFLTGILLGDFLNLPLSAWLWLSGCALILALLSRRLYQAISTRMRSFINLPRLGLAPEWALPRFSWFWLFLTLMLGGLRFVYQQPQWSPNFVAWYNDQEAAVVMEGVVIAPPEDGDAVTRLRVRVEKLHSQDDLLFQEVEGEILARVPPMAGWRYGDRVRLEGRLQTPPAGEGFSYREYLSRQGIYSYFSCYVCVGCSTPVDQHCARLIQRDQANPIRAAIYSLRQRAHQVIYHLFPDPEASLLAGILLGIEAGIPEAVDQAFRDTGTSHIIAISGFNFAIVAGLFASVFHRLLGRWRGMLAAFVGIAGYAILAGANAAVIRAAIMGGLSVFAAQMGRRQQGINSLLIVAGVMALSDPNVLWDVGFQLSFMATLGLVLYAQPLQKHFQEWAGRYLSEEQALRLAGPVSEYLLFTLAAQATTLPVIVYHFQRISLVSFLANPLILPAQPPIMILGGLAALLGLVFQPLGQLAAYLVWPFLIYTIRLVEWFAAWGNVVFVLGATSLLVVVLFYAILFAWTLWRTQPRQGLFQWLRIIPRWGVMAGLFSLVALALIAWQTALFAPDGLLHMTVFDVGSGDAILIRTPGGRTLLIDGGPSSSRLSDALGRRLPVWQRDLDYLVIAATGAEQVSVLPLTVERFSPKQVLWFGPATGDYAALALRRQLTQAQIPILSAQTGQQLELGQGATLQILAVTSRGAILLLCWDRFRALLPIGIEFNSLEALQDDALLGPVSVLLLADSGYTPLNPPGWISRWDPQLLLLSVAADDHEGRPTAETLDAVGDYPLLRTDQNGWLHLSTDGTQLWVEVERP